MALLLPQLCVIQPRQPKFLAGVNEVVLYWAVLYCKYGQHGKRGQKSCTTVSNDCKDGIFILVHKSVELQLDFGIYIQNSTISPRVLGNCV